MKSMTMPLTNAIQAFHAVGGANKVNAGIS
jgi:hypothetical protein